MLPKNVRLPVESYTCMIIEYDQLVTNDLGTFNNTQKGVSVLYSVAKYNVYTDRTFFFCSP